MKYKHPIHKVSWTFSTYIPPQTSKSEQSRSPPVPLEIRGFPVGFLFHPFFSKARKARALDIWESLKPDVEAEMARCGGGGNGMDADGRLGFGSAVFFVTNAFVLG